jgi:hypothetical protein
MIFSYFSPTFGQDILFKLSNKFMFNTIQFNQDFISKENQLHKLFTLVLVAITLTAVFLVAVKIRFPAVPRWLLQALQVPIDLLFSVTSCFDVQVMLPQTH